MTSAFEGCSIFSNSTSTGLNVTLGATVPTGKISKRGTTSTGARDVLPFTMQGGSGSPDILAGGTFLAQNEIASVGAQINSVIRVVDNGQDYRLGDRVQLLGVGAPTTSPSG